jgi:hypothetical protein
MYKEREKLIPQVVNLIREHLATQRCHMPLHVLLSGGGVGSFHSVSHIELTTAQFNHPHVLLIFQTNFYSKTGQLYQTI